MVKILGAGGFDLEKGRKWERRIDNGTDFGGKGAGLWVGFSDASIELKSHESTVHLTATTLMTYIS